MAPDANEEYLLYQTLVGAWPLGAVRSAKNATEFVKRDPGLHAQGPARGQGAHELDQPRPRLRRGRRRSSSGCILDEAVSRPFLDDFRAFQRRVSHLGLFNSLSQTLLKLASPGVPGHLPGDRAVGLQPGGPGQPPAGRLRARRALLRQLTVGRRVRRPATCANSAAS